MNPSMIKQLFALLDKHEDDKARAYLDIYGNITAGRGHNLSARDIAQDIRDRWTREDIQEFYNNWSSSFAWFNDLAEARQIALIDFSFIGWQKVLEFKNMLSCLEKGDMEGAGEEILKSLYHRQVGQRAQDIRDILVTGEIKWAY